VLKVLMLDLGGTLERNGALVPHARQSVQALSKFKLRDGSQLEYCLVSDFHAAEPFNEANVGALFTQYLEMLDSLGLRNLFDPVARRVTLSTHANVMKPDRRVFDLALKRLGVASGLDDCLFITEDTAHISAARALGMDCLQFGRDSNDGFLDWREGLLKIALKVDPASQTNLAAALGILGEESGLAEVRNVTVSPDRIGADAKTWLALDDPGLGDLEGVFVSVPATVEVEFSGAGPHLNVHLPEDANAEATAFVRSLQAHGKISGGPKSLLGPPTHAIVTDEAGRRILIRRAFD
jgi:hypothetical protein